MMDTIKKVTVSSIFDKFFHVTNSGEVIDMSSNSKVMSYLVAILEPKYYGKSNNHHNVHHDWNTIWFNYVNMNVINVHCYYEPLQKPKKY